MFKDFLSWSNINVKSMLRHGSVAVITMLGIGILFGEENIMLAFPIALMSILLDKQNIHIKPFSKIFRLIILDLLIVLTSYISSVNIFIGIPINFIGIFLIMYTLISPYDMTFYKPFIMLYVFTQYSAISINELPIRLLSVIFGVLVVAFFNILFNPDREKTILGKSIIKSLTLINNQIDNIIDGKFNLELSDKCTASMREVAYRIYLSRHKKYLMTYLGRIEFDIFLNIEHLNIYLSELNKNYSDKYKDDAIELKDLISVFISYCKDEVGLDDIKNALKKYCEKERPKEISHNIEVLEGLMKSFEHLNSLSKKQNNKIYKKWKRSDIDRVKTTFKEYFKPNTIRFKFAMRSALTLTFALFVGEMLGLYKVIWAIITIMSVIQPYYEDTIKRTKDRVKGNIVAILFVGVVINIVDVKLFTAIILIASLYLLYGYKEYHKISLFSGIASICVATLSENINELIFYRVVYVFIGVIIVIIANKTIFPYRIKDGISQLMIKIMRVNNIFINNSIEYIKGENNAYVIRDLMLHLTLLGQKLYLRNLQYGDERVTKFINAHNKYAIESGYKLLKEYKKPAQ